MQETKTSNKKMAYHEDSIDNTNNQKRPSYT